MAISRRVTHTGKANDGTISSLCNPGEYWSPRSGTDAVHDIDTGSYRYRVSVRGQEVDVHVVNGHLRTDPDNGEQPGRAARLLGRAAKALERHRHGLIRRVPQSGWGGASWVWPHHLS